MFGYVRACKPELKIKEYETYKAVYCSLCRLMGREYGFWSRFTLSYDFTFLALLNMSLKSGCDPVERGRCFFNPLKKCNYCKNSEPLYMPAAAAMIMCYYKLLDNISDEKGIKKIGYIIIKPLFKRANKKAAKKFPQLEKIISDYISAQTALEEAGCRELDAAADPTALLLSKILQLCSESPAQKRVLDRMGYCIGRYIYLLDAACDLPDDIKSGSYNCLSYTCEGDPAEYAKNRITPQLYFCANEAGKAFELLDIKKYRSLLGNIIYLGLEDTFKKELGKNDKSV